MESKIIELSCSKFPYLLLSPCSIVFYLLWHKPHIFFYLPFISLFSKMHYVTFYVLRGAFLGSERAPLGV